MSPRAKRPRLNQRLSLEMPIRGAFVDRSSILRASTISNRQVDTYIYLPFISCPYRGESNSMQGASVKQTRSVCSERARDAGRRPGRANSQKANTRILRAKPRPDMDAMLSNPSLPCATSTESQTRGESNSMQGRGRKENALATQTGTRFPDGSPGGKHVPESALRLGCSFGMMPQAESCDPESSRRVGYAFPMAAQAESTSGIFVRNGMQFPNEWLAESSSRNLASNWDTLSASPAASKTCAPSIPKLGRRRPKRNRRRSI